MAVTEKTIKCISDLKIIEAFRMIIPIRNVDLVTPTPTSYMGCLKPGQLSGQGCIHVHRTPWMYNIKSSPRHESFGARITQSSS